MSTRREKEEGASDRNMERTVEREGCDMGFRTWREVERTAIDRKRWKDSINGTKRERVKICCTEMFKVNFTNTVLNKLINM